MSKQNLKALALAPMAGFRKKEVIVPEWESAKVIIREPSAEAWIRWQAIASPEAQKPPEGQEAQEATELTPSERAFRTMRADVTLFIDILLDTDLQYVFTIDDTEQVEAIYGPIHSRLLKQALDLVHDADDAKAK
ncbi:MULTISPECIES: phage tail assembly chaperone [Klebsiella/Raoultella group]|uniref:phage tail assembly chaperone n=1 Tax=Klebsiella/Raoultella group TaxID=2890311 RepID=UPI001265D33D|nr:MULTISPECIES: phage tail assembly chaperone [Klebsiella/Raoultella group]KAB8155471.1 phage tail protein [Raoultella ornithinolytica]KAB8169571.1 phage tail protein [Raoultella ornithinolytica]MCD9997580.1 phage tail assembly chaperone [Klebsiella quasipneumoniae subsp. similipneumoniae]MDP0667304.1 phage tail assembly chaperone [Klebsiella pneumoniae]MDP0810703.1 phage tail assembly chaperone [Klebsiella pneumoniae]